MDRGRSYCTHSHEAESGSGGGVWLLLLLSDTESEFQVTTNEVWETARDVRVHSKGRVDRFFRASSTCRCVNAEKHVPGWAWPSSCVSWRLTSSAYAAANRNSTVRRRSCGKMSDDSYWWEASEGCQKLKETELLLWMSPGEFSSGNPQLQSCTLPRENQTHLLP